MKILHLSSARITYRGGTEKVILELARRQSKKNQVTILQTNLYEEKVPFREVELKEGIEIITCKNDYFLKGFGYSGKFKKKLRSIWKDFDIVHIHGHGRFTSNFSLGYLYGKKPIIYSPQGFFHNKKNKLFKKIYNFLFKKRIQSATISTALTEVDYRLFRDLGVKKDSIRILPGGIDLKKFKEIDTDKINKFKKKYGLEKNTLLFVGRIHESKGLQYVLEAIEGIDCKLLIVGKDGGYKEILVKKSRELRVQNKVLFLGALDDVELVEAYFSSDIFILFSEWEGFGIVLVEAMAANLPVIASDRGSLPILIKNKQNGLIVEFKNLEKLRKAIKKLLTDKKLENKLIKNGRKTAEKYDWDIINKKVEKIYHEAIKKFRK